MILSPAVAALAPAVKAGVVSGFMLGDELVSIPALSTIADYASSAAICLHLSPLISLPLFVQVWNNISWEQAPPPLPLLSLPYLTMLPLLPSLILIPVERIISCSESRFSLLFHLLQRRGRAAV